MGEIGGLVGMFIKLEMVFILSAKKKKKYKKEKETTTTKKKKKKKKKRPQIIHSKFIKVDYLASWSCEDHGNASLPLLNLH